MDQGASSVPPGGSKAAADAAALPTTTAVAEDDDFSPIVDNIARVVATFDKQRGKWLVRKEGVIAVVRDSRIAAAAYMLKLADNSPAELKEAGGEGTTASDTERNVTCGGRRPENQTRSDVESTHASTVQSVLSSNSAVARWAQLRLGKCTSAAS